MKLKKVQVVAVSLCMLGLSTLTQADGFSKFKKSIEKIAKEAVQEKPNNVNAQNNQPGKDFHWVDIFPGQAVPPKAVVGGFENGRALFVCHGNYNGGMHPGKLVGNNCNIGYGGREVVLSKYQVLVSKFPLNWVRTNNGFIPGNAVRGGIENGQPLFICQANYLGGMHSGKVVGNQCNFGYGGKEIVKPFYNVLVR